LKLNLNEIERPQGLNSARDFKYSTVDHMISPDKSQGKAKDDDFFSLSDNDPLFQDDLHEYEEDNDIPTPDHAFINKGLKKQSADGLKQQRKVFVTYEN